MISSVGQGNNVQRFSAVNALKSSANFNINNDKQASDSLTEVQNDTTSVVKTAPKGLLDKVDVSDIRKNAEYVGEFNISDDDIKYGLMYGRSVIAEFLC
jgi:hypothetical protein